MGVYVFKQYGYIIGGKGDDIILYMLWVNNLDISLLCLLYDFCLKNKRLDDSLFF